jgi:two-component system OmpR family response regulator
MSLERILYVEDEPDIRTVAMLALEELGGFQVIECAEGNAALAAACGARADLILLDVMMPGMDGPATLRALRDIPDTAATPVIFMTAKVQAAEIAQFRAMGALGVIAKPFDPMELPLEIRRLWDSQAA